MKTYVSEEAMAEYRNFLRCVIAEPHKEHKPSPLADAAWHAHILDTKEYVEFCNAEFGYFLHHTPGVGYCATSAKEE